MKNITFTHEARAIITDYLKIKKQAKEMASTEKAKKKEVEEVFAEYGKTMADKSKSSFVGGFIQRARERVGIVYRKTWTRGNIDWQAYALELGGTLEDAERFRKAGHWTIAIDEATPEQQTELEERL